MTNSNKIAVVIAGVVIALASLWYGQNSGLLPIAASQEAMQVDSIFKLMLTVSAGLFLLIEGVLIYSAIRFRQPQGDETDGPHIEGNVPLEIVWTAVPAVIVFIVSIYSFEVYNEMGGLDPTTSRDPGPQQLARQTQTSQSDRALVAFVPGQRDLALGLGTSPEPKAEPPLVIEVQGLQYAWIFTYPDTGVVSGEIHIPVGREVRLNITAADVLHSFWLPEFRIKQDAIPGRESTLRFTSNRLGDYAVVCAELCGPYHGAMNTRLYVESEEDFQDWLQQQIASSDPLDRAVAVNSTERSPSEVLAPYAQQMGINAQTVEYLSSQALPVVNEQ